MVFNDDKVKETWNSVYLTEDAQYTIYIRGLFNANELYYRKTGDTGELKTISCNTSTLSILPNIKLTCRLKCNKLLDWKRNLPNLPQLTIK